MKNQIKMLEKRGWSKEEINKALNIIHNAKQIKTPETRFLEKRTYWILLVIIAIANFAISISIIPILIAIHGLFLYFLMAFFGIAFGFLIEIVIRSIEHLERKHHAFLVFFVPFTALLNIFFIIKVSNQLATTLNPENIHDPLTIALVYAASFVLPYIFYRFVLKIDYYAEK